MSTFRPGDFVTADELNSELPNVASTSTPGMVRPDGLTITVTPDGVISSVGGTARPGGSNGQIQFNNFGSLGGYSLGAGLTVQGGNLVIAFGTDSGSAAAGNDARLVNAEQITNKGIAGGYASLGLDGRIPAGQIPALAAAGVSSFNSRTGVVTLGSADVTSALGFTPYDAANPTAYQTAAQVSSAISAAAYALPVATTTVLGGVKQGTGVSIGVDGTISATGSAGVTTFNTRTGAITLTSGDVTGALTFTPYNAANPSGYQTAAQVAAALVPAGTTGQLQYNNAGAFGGLTVGTSLAVAAGAINVAVSATNPAMDGTATPGDAATMARSNHVHPTDTSRLAVASNLSDVASVATARTNLGLGGAAVLNVGTAAGTVAAGNDTRITGALQSAAIPATGGLLGTSGTAGTASAVTASTGLTLSGGALTVAYGTTATTAAVGNDTRITGAAQKASNLSDLASAPTARTNLGLGGAATLAVGTAAGTVAAGDDSRITGAAQKASNLSDLASAATARTNLGISTVGTTGAYADLTGRPNGSATLSFGMGAVVANGTVNFDVPYAATLTTLKYNVGTAGGSFGLKAQIGGVDVTGLTGITVNSSTDATSTASGANAISANGRVSLVFSGTTGAPTDAVITATWTH